MNWQKKYEEYYKQFTEEEDMTEEDKREKKMWFELGIKFFADEAVKFRNESLKKN